MPGPLQFFFGVHGRLNRLAFHGLYLASSAYALAVGIILLCLFSDDPPPAAIVALLPAMAAMFSGLVRRLHDRNHSAWWLGGVPLPPLAVIGLGHLLLESGYLRPAQLEMVITPLFLIASIPLAWFGIEIFVLPGTSGSNRFGPPQVFRHWGWE